MLFLCGLFSLLDVLLQRPLLQILEEVGAPEETVELLVYKRGPFKELGSLMLAYEQGQWEAVEASSQKLNLPTCEVAQAYLDALEWCPRVGR